MFDQFRSEGNTMLHPAHGVLFTRRVCANVASMNTPQVIYVAERDAADHTVDARKLVVTGDGGQKALRLPPRLDLRSHSPAGFEFGYAGSGPAQLALAILADALGPDRAVELYQSFKRAFVAPADGDELRITREQVEEWAARQALPPADALDVWGESLGD